MLILFFKLFRCNDQSLRELLFRTIVQDIKNANVKHKDNKLNKSLQNFMYNMLNDTCTIAAKKSVEVMVELFRKNVWNDERTVNILAEACLSKSTKVSSTAVHFFLGNDDHNDDEDDEDDVPDLANMRHAAHVAGMSKARATKLKKAMVSIKKKEKKGKKAEAFNFSAILLLNNPQSFCESLFDKVRDSNDHIDSKMILMNLISRVIGIHKTLVLSFYPYLIKYLRPHQKDVTLVLVFAAQASHELVPPDVIETLIMAIANNFVNDTCSPEVITVGLNGIREICGRCPYGMTETLLQDLAQYKSYKNRGNYSRKVFEYFLTNLQVS